MKDFYTGVERRKDTMQQFEGLWKATPEKRYKHFLNYVADYESVWMLSNENGFSTIDIEDTIYLLVWPAKEFAVAFDSMETPVEIEVHDFGDRCEEMMGQDEVQFMVFPTNKDTYIVDATTLWEDINEQLNLLE